MALSEEERKARKKVYADTYNQRPEVKARRKAYYKTYNQTPEAKARRKAYNQTPEAKALKKARNSTPEAKARAKTHQRKPKIKAREKARKRWKRYNLTSDHWNMLFASQGFKCAICGTDDPSHKSGWHTDHSHTTSKVRGILCPSCNQTIGRLGDEYAEAKAFTDKVLEYLETHRE